MLQNLPLSLSNLTGMYYFTSHRNPLSKITNANLAKIVKGLGSDGLANYASLLKTQQMG